MLLSQPIGNGDVVWLGPVGCWGLGSRIGVPVGVLVWVGWGAIACDQRVTAKWGDEGCSRDDPWPFGPAGRPGPAQER